MGRKEEHKLIDELDDYKAVIVKWKDAHYTADGWTPFADVDESLPICYTIGVLIDETEDAYVIAQSIAEDTDVLNVMNIPKGMIASMQELK